MASLEVLTHRVTSTLCVLLGLALFTMATLGLVDAIDRIFFTWDSQTPMLINSFYNQD